MKKNEVKVSAKRMREIEEMFEKRAILVMADGKVEVGEDKTSLYVFLSNYTPINLKMFDICYVRFDLVQKSIEEEYLVKIWIDEDNIFRAEDICPKGKNWFSEVKERKIKKLRDAFGWVDEDEV